MSHAAETARRIAIENYALPDSAAEYRPMRDGEQRRDGAGAIWTVALVKGRLQEAAEVIERTTRRDGPAGLRGAWPEIRREFGDLVHGGMEARARYASERNRTVIRYTAHEISRATEAIEWPGRYLAADAHADPRRWLQLWLWSEATGAGWGDLVDRACGALATANRRRLAAIEIIMHGLKRDGIAP